MPELEGPDDPISMARASTLSGISEHVLEEHAGVGRLQAVFQNVWWTTRRSLHVYLLNDLGDHRGKPLPPGYVAPDGEPRRKTRQYVAATVREVRLTAS